MPRFGKIAALAAPASMRRLRLGGAALTLAILTIASSGAPVLGWSSSSFSSDDEALLFTLTNQDRASAGLDALVNDSYLHQKAEWRAQDMGDRDYFSHTIPPDNQMVFYYMQQDNYCFKVAGENIGLSTYGDDVATNRIETAFMNSATHRANILGDWQHMGVGAYEAADGRKLYTVLFSTPCSSPKPKPTLTPTAQPTAQPTPELTSQPTAQPTSDPNAPPTAEPTVQPTAQPSVAPTPKPTARPTVKPTARPTVKPTARPTATATPLVTPTPLATPTAAVESPTPLVTPAPLATPTAAASPTPTPSGIPAATEPGEPTPRIEASPGTSPESSPAGSEGGPTGAAGDSTASLRVREKTPSPGLFDSLFKMLFGGLFG